MNLMKNIFLTLTFLLLNLFFAHANWTKINSIPSQEIIGLEVLNDTLYAATNTNIIYRSIDAGLNWDPITVTNSTIEISSLKIIDNKIYCGTLASGIFSSDNAGFSWTHWMNIILPVYGIEKFNNILYASTLGAGVYRYDQNGNNWIAMNNQLPTYSFNVTTITSTPSDLIIGAGANGTYYKYDFTANQWIENYFYGNLLPGLDIDQMIYFSDTLFAVNRNTILISTDGGTSWTNDKNGSHNGYVRNIYVGSNYVYTITNILGGGTWLQQRIRNASIGSNWDADEELFLTNYTYDIIEFNNKLFLAKDDGLYVKDLVTSTNDFLDQYAVTIFPNPSKGPIQIFSTVVIKKIVIKNLLNETVYHADVNAKKIELQNDFGQGVYLVSILLSNNQTVKRKIVRVEN